MWRIFYESRPSLTLPLMSVADDDCILHTRRGNGTNLIRFTEEQLIGVLKEADASMRQSKPTDQPTYVWCTRRGKVRRPSVRSRNVTKRARSVAKDYTERATQLRVMRTRCAIWRSGAAPDRQNLSRSTR